MQALTASLSAVTIGSRNAGSRGAQNKGVALSQRAALAATPVSLGSTRRAVPLVAQRSLVVRAAVTEVRGDL